MHVSDEPRVAEDTCSRLGDVTGKWDDDVTAGDVVGTSASVSSIVMT